MLAEMLSIYASIYGHTFIPRSFIVPSNSTVWPLRFHDAKVGVSLNNIRSRYRKKILSSHAIALLEAHHIVWEPLSRPWSSSRTKVGMGLSDLRHRYRRDDLALLGSPRTVQEPLNRSWSGTVTTQVLAQMMSIYASIHGHTSIPQSFVVPLNSNDWPTNFHGAKVGKCLADIHSQYRKNNLSSDTIALLGTHEII